MPLGFLQGQSNLINLGNNAVVSVRDNALIKVNGNIVVSTGAALTETGDSRINVTGDLENNGTIDSDAGEISFVGAGDSEIKGSVSPNLNDVTLNKDNSTDNLFLDNNANLTGDLSVNSGIFQFVNTQARALDVDGSLSIAAAGQINVQSSFRTHNFNLAGNLTNNGILDFHVLNGNVTLTFDGSGNSIISGTGATTDFASIIVNKANPTDEVQVSPAGQNLTNFNAIDGFLTLTQGIFHFLGQGVLSFTNSFFTPSANLYYVPSGSGLWIENTGVTVSAQDASLVLGGLLRMNGGNFNVGAGSSERSIFYTDGSELHLEAGNIYISNALCRDLLQDNSAITFTMSGGDLSLGYNRAVVNTRAIFDIGYSNSTFNWSGGDITLPLNSGIFANGDFYVKTVNGTVTGGRLVIESATANDLLQQFSINSDMPIGELLMTTDNNPRVDLLDDLVVLGNVTLTNRAIRASSYSLTVGGQWINNSATPASFDYGSGNVIFNGSTDQTIGGSQSTDFNQLSANKTGGNLILNHDVNIASALRLVSNTILDMQSNDITIAQGADIFSDFSTNQDFSDTKYIMNSGGATGGRLIRNLQNNPTLPMSEFIIFPVGTPGAYTFAWVRLLSGTYNSNPGIIVRPIAQEHPQVKKNNVSLTKYWEISTFGNFSPGVEGTTLRFLYDQAEVQGSEGNYHIIKYLGGGWDFDPALSNNIDFGNNFIKPERFSNDISGDWTAGEEDAVAAKYYSIADGNFSDPNTWSRTSYGDLTPATTAPNSNTDLVFIGDGKTVTLTANTSAARRIQIDSTGTLMCNDYLVSSTVDTLLLKAGGGIGIGHSGSIALSANDGNVRAGYRFYSDDAMYIFTGNNNQSVRDIPARVSALVLNKTQNSNIVTLNKSIVIGDSLIINEGTLDQVNDSYFIDGEAPGKFFTMRGGTLILKDEFPTNYLPATMEGGTLDFFGISGINVPSNTSSPAVLRYNNLTFRGNRGYNKITFSPSGQINIAGNLSITGATFSNFPETWIATNGSTIAFIGDGNQNIPRLSGLNNQWGRLNYYNLVIGGTGVKTINDNIDYVVTNNLTINSATLRMANGGNELEVYGNWLNTGGGFDYGSNQTVIFKTISGDENTIAPNNVPFYRVEIDGAGTARFIDEMTVENEIQINSGATFAGGNAATLHVLGLWDNNGNQFSPGNSTVSFDGNAAQIIDIANSTEEKFYNLTINSGNNVGAFTNGTPTANRLWVENNLHLERGYLYLPNSDDYIRVDGNATRNATNNSSAFVHGNYRQYIERDAATYFIPVGYEAGTDAFTGIELEMTGTGGTEGYLNIYTDNVAANSPRFNEIDRKWEITIPTGSTFDLGVRNYDVIFNFHPNDAVGFNTAVFETRRRTDGINWIAPNTGVRTATSTESLNNNTLAAIGGVTEFIVGESSYSIFYSVNNGNWSNPATWSTVGWGGAPEAVVTPLSTDSIRIADGYTVTLDVNFTIDIDKAVVVETAGLTNTPGKLELGTNQINGTGAFVVKSGGILGIGDANGVTAASASGNIRTSIRDYNYNNANKSYFVYNGNVAQVTGDGIPDVVGGLVANSSVGVTLSKAVAVADSFLIQSNYLDASASNYKLTIGANWINQGTFVPRAGTVEFNGSVGKEITNTNIETFYNLIINKASGNVTITDNSVTVTNNLTFTKGNLDARTYSQFVTIDNGATVNRTSGHVDGELRKYLATGDLPVATYEVGFGTDYTPVVIDVNGTGGTAGFAGVISNDGDHPQFLTAALNPSKNVQRYWSVNTYGFDLGAGRTYDITLNYLYPDDIRGGADPNLFEVRRYNLGWNIPTTGIRTNSSTQGTGITDFGIDFMVGEPGGSGRVFYSIASGAWNTVGNWSEIGYGGVASANFPDLNTDIVFIGDNKYIDLDASRQLTALTVENGGKINFSTNVITGTQFTLKKDGIIEVASASGITNATAAGNVQTSIRNYNHSNHNSARIIYSGNAATTGDGIPTALADVIFNTSGTILLEKDITVSDSVLISSGTLSANNFDITLSGNFVNNSGFVPTASSLMFEGGNTQYLTGSSASDLNILELNKSAGNLNLGNDITIASNINFTSNTKIILNQNDITIAPNALILGTSLGSNQMIVADGTLTSGRIIKLFADGIAATRNIDIPLGIGNAYYGVEIDLVADFSSAQMDIRVINGKHPNRRAGYENVLNKYWTINTSGISNIQEVAGTNYKFNYLPSDVNGTAALYGAARYTGFGWDIDLGATSSATPSPIDIKQYQTLNGEWTAGYPNSFRSGQIYYSIGTGDWDNNLVWSNVSHSGDASRFYPGRLENDTVYIASNDLIYYNVSSSTIGILSIGDGSQGRLDFNDSQDQSLRIKEDFIVGTSGQMEQYSSGNRRDTIYIEGNITNNSTTLVNFDHGGSDYTILKIVGTGNTIVSGTGNWNFYDVYLNKTGGLADTLINQSSGFTNQLDSDIDNGRFFYLQSGVFRHDINLSLRLDDNNITNDQNTWPDPDPLDFRMGDNAGIDVKQGTIRIWDDLHAGTNNSFLIDGGSLLVGNGNNENFVYGLNNKFEIRSGTFTVPACFTPIVDPTTYEPQGTLDMIIAGGTITVMDIYSNQTRNIYGFGLLQSSSLTWTGGTLIYSNPTNGGFDYVVKTGTWSVTGGTLQFGEPGNWLGAGQRHSWGSVTPVYNLVINECRQSSTGNYSSCILVENDNNVLNDVIIESNGVLDLDGNNLFVQGNFINNGRFTTDGREWNSGGTKTVTLNGTGDQIFQNANNYVNAQSSSSMNNEPFYNLVIDKPSGNVILGDYANSYLNIRNTLIFAENNTAVIEARTNSHYVAMTPRSSSGDLEEVTRLGLGHVDGTLIRNFYNGSVDYRYFYVGAGDDYTPAEVEFNGSFTSGPIDVTAFGTDPAGLPDNDEDIDLTRNIQRYWSVEDNGSFNLGSADFDLTLHFINPTDFRNSSNWTLYKHFRFPLPPGPAPVNYVQLDNVVRTDTTTKSLANTIFGNYMIAELTGTRFYSIANGAWDDPATWSKAGYGGVQETIDYPNDTGDEAYIGDGFTVTLSNLVPNIKSTVVETHNGKPGYLQIADDAWVTGQSFVLKDSCYLATQHNTGLQPVGINDGSVRTVERIFGVGHYIFNSDVDFQVTGNALPDFMLSFTVNNTAPSIGFRVVTNNNSNEITIFDSLNVVSGMLDAGSGIEAFSIRGGMYFGAMSDLRTNTRVFDIEGNRTQYITLDKDDSIRFRQLNIYKTSAPDSVIVSALGDDSHIRVTNRLRFGGGNRAFIKVLNDSRIVINEGASLERLGATPFGHIDGYLSKPIAAAAVNQQFEIGYGLSYAPATILLDAGTTGGTYGFLNARNIMPVPDEPFYGNRMDPNVRVPRYWNIIADPDNGMLMGDRELNIRFEMPLAEAALINQNNGVIRRRSIPTEVPEWQDRREIDLVWSLTTVGTVELKSNPTQSWPGFGDFFIGEKAARIFYSQGTGVWNDHNSWAFDAAGTIPVPAGEFPNPDWDSPELFEFEYRDSVVIQNTDVITLNTQPQLAYVDFKDDGKLVISPNTFLSQSVRGESTFNMGDNFTLELRTPDGIEPYTDGGAGDGVVRFENRTFEPTVNFGFAGNGSHYFGSAFPDVVNNIYVDSEGDATSITAIAPKDVSINGSLDLISGNLRPRDASSALHFAGDITLAAGTSFDATLDYLNNPVTTTNYIEGSGATNQTISGDGFLVFSNLEMNRGAGTGLLYADKSLEIAGVLDMRSGTNANPQIFEIGNNGNVSVSSANPNAIVDFGANNYIRTSETSGSLCREITTGETYVFPLGSLDAGSSNYTPANLISGVSGNNGQVCVRTSRGAHATLAGGHSELPVERTEDYLARYWAVTGVTTDISGRWNFNYDNSDIRTDEANIVSIGRWSNPFETTPGSWLAVSGTVSFASNIFDTDIEIPSTDFAGDWTAANEGAFRSIFYSRQSGLWSNENSWTYAKDHIGPIAGVGLFPAAAKDSVVIGGGNNGVGNHVIRLDANYELGGVLVGTGTSNTGTLDMSEFVITGTTFNVSPNSTINIGSPAGINAIGTDIGNVQTTDTRYFGGLGSEINIVMNATQDQALGNAFPVEVRDLTIANTGADGNNTVLFDKNIRINNDLNLNSGTADLQNFSLNTANTGTVNMLNGSWLRLNSTNDLSGVINGYAAYNLELGSVVEFYGDNQVISNLPANLTNGLATVWVNLSGTKFVTSSLLIRGDLYIQNSATLQNDPTVDALQINGDVYNAALINNDGVIQICN